MSKPRIGGLISSFISHPLFSGSAIMFAGGMGINVVNYIYHLVFARVLGPQEYGTLAALYSILYITSIIPLSTSVSIVKFISGANGLEEKRYIYSKINRFVFIVALIISLAIVVSTPFVSDFLKIADPVAILLIAPIVFFSLLALVNQSTAQGSLNFVGYTIPNLVSSVGKFGIGYILIVLGFMARGAMVGVLISVCFAYLASLFFVAQLRSGKVVNTNFRLKKFLRYSFPVLIQAISFTSIFTTDLILAKHYLDPHQAGIYAALSTLGKIIFFASSPIASTMFPIVSQRHARGESYSKIFQISLLLTAVISFGAAVLYWLIPSFIINTLYGEKYLEASNYLVWMGLFIAFYSLAYLLINFSLSFEKTKIVIVPLLASLVQVVLIYLFHSDILQILQVSTYTTVGLFFVSLIVVMYNWNIKTA